MGGVEQADVIAARPSQFQFSPPRGRCLNVGAIMIIQRVSILTSAWEVSAKGTHFPADPLCIINNPHLFPVERKNDANVNSVKCDKKVSKNLSSCCAERPAIDVR